MKFFTHLFEGKVGNVLNEDDFNEKFSNEFNKDMTPVCEIGNFYLDDCEQWLCKSDGSKGEGCYEGFLIRNDEVYYMDIALEGMIYKVN